MLALQFLVNVGFLYFLFLFSDGDVFFLFSDLSSLTEINLINK